MKFDPTKTLWTIISFTSTVVVRIQNQKPKIYIARSKQKQTFVVRFDTRGLYCVKFIESRGTFSRSKQGFCRRKKNQGNINNMGVTRVGIHNREMEYIESASVTFFFSCQVRTPKMHFIACIILEKN